MIRHQKICLSPFHQADYLGFHPSPLEPTIPIPSSTNTNTMLDNTPVFSATDQHDICSPIDASLPYMRTHDVFMTIEDAIGKIYTDQTGRLPVTSTWGNKYILVAYNFDSNTMNAEPTKSCTDLDLLKAYKQIQILLEQRGLKLRIHFLNNECPNIFKTLMQEKEEKYQLAPPHIHRRNAAEKAIGTFKDYFISDLACLPPNFPLQLWWYRIPQATLTLNLLWPSCINPHLSAHAQLHGAYDFNATPLDPPGIEALIHKKPSERGTWAFRGIDRWYIGPSPEHYRCYKCIPEKTNSVRISDTVHFFPAKCKNSICIVYQ